MPRKGSKRVAEKLPELPEAIDVMPQVLPVLDSLVANNFAHCANEFVISLRQHQYSRSMTKLRELQRLASKLPEAIDVMPQVLPVLDSLAADNLAHCAKEFVISLFQHQSFTAKMMGEEDFSAAIGYHWQSILAVAWSSHCMMLLATTSRQPWFLKRLDEFATGKLFQIDIPDRLVFADYMFLHGQCTLRIQFPGYHPTILASRLFVRAAEANRLRIINRVVWEDSPIYPLVSADEGVQPSDGTMTLNNRGINIVALTLAMDFPLEAAGWLLGAPNVSKDLPEFYVRVVEALSDLEHYRSKLKDAHHTVTQSLEDLQFALHRIDAWTSLLTQKTWTSTVRNAQASLHKGNMTTTRSSFRAGRAVESTHEVIFLSARHFIFTVTDAFIKATRCVQAFPIDIILYLLRLVQHPIVSVFVLMSTRDAMNHGACYESGRMEDFSENFLRSFIARVVRNCVNINVLHNERHENENQRHLKLSTPIGQQVTNGATKNVTTVACTTTQEAASVEEQRKDKKRYAAQTSGPMMSAWVLRKKKARTVEVDDTMFQ